MFNIAEGVSGLPNLTKAHTHTGGRIMKLIKRAVIKRPLRDTSKDQEPSAADLMKMEFHFIPRLLNHCSETSSSYCGLQPCILVSKFEL